MSPFLPAQSFGKFRPKVWQDIVPENNTAQPLIPQLMGNKSEHFVDTIRMLNEQFGYEQFNINIGCPSSPVVRHTRGCGLMPHPDKVEDIVSAVTSQTPFRLSLKMRLGLHRVDEGRTLLERLNSYPLDFLVIHPRLGDDLYEGQPKWDIFEEFCLITRHKIVYSGDIFTVEDFRMLSERFPKVSAWMLGRGMLRNPFLAEEIKGQEVGEKHKRFFAFHQDFIEELLPIRGEQGTLANLKELWHYFAVFMGLSEDNLNQLLRVCDFKAFIALSMAFCQKPKANS